MRKDSLEQQRVSPDQVANAALDFFNVLEQAFRTVSEAMSVQEQESSQFRI